MIIQSWFNLWYGYISWSGVLHIVVVFRSIAEELQYIFFYVHIDEVLSSFTTPGERKIITLTSVGFEPATFGLVVQHSNHWATTDGSNIDISEPNAGSFHATIYKIFKCNDCGIFKCRSEWWFFASRCGKTRKNFIYEHWIYPSCNIPTIVTYLLYLCELICC